MTESDIFLSRANRFPMELSTAALSDNQQSEVRNQIENKNQYLIEPQEAVEHHNERLLGHWKPTPVEAMDPIRGKNADTARYNK